MKKFASGIFCWDSPERRTSRYGYVYAADSDYDRKVTVTPTLKKNILDSLKGKKVKITCKVTANRESGHVGDRFVLDGKDYIKPSKPKKGEKIVIGVGILDLQKNYDGNPMFGLMPEDGREIFWMDPRNLYRLHDQTVDFHIEETKEVFSPVTTLQLDEREGCIDNGDGTIQVKTKRNLDKTFKVKPNIECLGDGLLMVEQPGGKPGKFFEFGD